MSNLRRLSRIVTDVEVVDNQLKVQFARPTRPGLVLETTPLTGNAGFDASSGAAITNMAVGIGVASTTYKLEVAGTAKISGALEAESLTVQDLSVLGTTTTINTATQVSDRVEITNLGTGPALKVTQTGAQPLAEFFDSESGTALYISDNGQIGVGHNNPAEKFEVTGNVKATGNINAVGALQINGTAVVDSSRNVNGATVAVGGTTVVDASRNLTNINAVTCASITASGTITANKVATSQSLIISLTDELSTVLTGADVFVCRAPAAWTINKLPRLSVSTASTAGVVEVDVKVNDVSIFGTTKLSIDALEVSSTTAAAAPAVPNVAVADDAEISVDILQAGTGAKGLKLVLYFTPA